MIRASWPFLFAVVPVVLLSRPPAYTTGEHQPPLLPRVELLRAVGASELPLVTDYFWIQTLQAIGRAKSPEEARDIYDYAQMVIPLDPHFFHVYVLAGPAIAWEVRPDVWANTRESTEVLRQGVKEVPTHVLMRILLAYNLASFEHKYQEAGELLAQTAKLPGAPSYLAPLATRMLAQGGAYDAALDLAQSLAAAAPDEQTRATFEMRVKQVLLERVCAAVDAAANRFRVRELRAPRDVGELIQAHDLPGVPQDPMGGAIVLGTDGRAHSSIQPERLELHGLHPTVAQPAPAP